MADAVPTPPPAKKPKRFYRYKTFWLGVFLALWMTFAAIFNWILNNPDYQQKAANFAYEQSRTKLTFNHIKFNLFSGEVSGDELEIWVEKTNLILALKD